MVLAASEVSRSPILLCRAVSCLRTDQYDQHASFRLPYREDLQYVRPIDICTVVTVRTNQLDKLAGLNHYAHFTKPLRSTRNAHRYFWFRSLFTSFSCSSETVIADAAEDITIFWRCEPSILERSIGATGSTGESSGGTLPAYPAHDRCRLEATAAFNIVQIMQRDSADGDCRRLPTMRLMEAH